MVQILYFIQFFMISVPLKFVIGLIKIQIGMIQSLTELRKV